MSGAATKRARPEEERRRASATRRGRRTRPLTVTLAIRRGDVDHVGGIQSTRSQRATGFGSRPRIESAGPSKRISSAPTTRRSRATAARLSPDTSAVTSVTPAARASAISSSRQRRADAALLVVIRDRDRDLGTAPVPHEARDRDGPIVPVDIRDECVVACVNGGERPQVPVVEVRLGAEEAPAPRLLAKPIEDGNDRLDVTSAKRPDEQPRAVPELDHPGMHCPRLRRHPLQRICAALAGSLTDL